VPPGLPKLLAVEEPEYAPDDEQYDLVEGTGNGREAEHTTPSERPWDPAIANDDPYCTHRPRDEAPDGSHTATLGPPESVGLLASNARHRYSGVPEVPRHGSLAHTVSCVEGAMRRGVVRLLLLQVTAFLAVGLLVAAVLDLAGALDMGNALFVAALVVVVCGGLSAIETNDLPVAFSRYASGSATWLATVRPLGIDMLPSSAGALAGVSGFVAAARSQ
jgi:hypothetical protein